MEKISWNTHEYLHSEKTADWYWMVGIVTVSIALISVIMNNIIFAILVIVSSFTLSLFASRKPRLLQIDIDNLGITVGTTRYSYNQLESYWIETRENHPRILIKSKKLLMPLVIIFFEEIDHEKIHNALSAHLPEQEQTEPLLEKVLIYLGF